jgi:ElaA protein
MTNTIIFVSEKNDTMNWIFKPFSEYRLSEFYEILHLRSEVFVVEQHCAYLDLDYKDQEAVHLCGKNKKDALVAYCRIFPPGNYFKECCIGRVVTAPAARRRGLGQSLMKEAIAYINRHWPEENIRISGQLYLKGFYESLGFLQVSDVYMEDDIPHIAMLLIARE